MKLFLSHSSEDKGLARRLALDLRSASFDVWLDHWEIGVGAEIAQHVERGVDEADFVVVLLTRASVASDWVDREWRRKLEHEVHTKRIALVPVRAKSCEIPDFLAQRSYADISGGSYAHGFKHLLDILHHYAGTITNADVEPTVVEDESVPNLIPIVAPVELEVGRDLIALFQRDSEGANRFLDELAPRLRGALRVECGFPFPGIRIRGNDTDMPPRAALILIEEVPEVLFEVGLDEVLVEATAQRLAALGIAAQEHTDPATDRELARIAACDRKVARDAGLATHDAAEYLALALQSVMRRMAPLFLDMDVTGRLVDALEPRAPELVRATLPKVLSLFELTDVLRHVLAEGIGVEDLERIFGALAQCGPGPHDPVQLTEQVRHALCGQITARFTRGSDSLSVLRLDPRIEALMSQAIQRSPAGSYLALKPKLTQDILAAVRTRMGSLGVHARGVPILVDNPDVRRYVRKLVELELPSLHVLSRQDLLPETGLRVIAQIELGDDPPPPKREDGEPAP